MREARAETVALLTASPSLRALAGNFRPYIHYLAKHFKSRAKLVSGHYEVATRQTGAAQDDNV
jgi:hypothetical protein